MQAQTFDTSEIARLDDEVRRNKRLEREHRRRAQTAAQQRDKLIEFCRANGIPVTEVGAAQGGTADD